jgi:hypothetical protein
MTEGSDQLPTESTIKRMAFLQEEMKKHQAIAADLFKRTEMLNAGLKKEKLAPLTTIDQETFLKNYNAPAQGGKSGWDEMMGERE